MIRLPSSSLHGASMVSPLGLRGSMVVSCCFGGGSTGIQGDSMVPSCPHGTSVVFPSCVHGTSAVLPWCLHGASVVLARRPHASVVLPCFPLSASMVSLWCFHGVPVVPLWRFRRCPWRFRGGPVVSPWCFYGVP